MNALAKPANLKGYASPRSFSGFQIPIPLQSLTIRRYCEDRGLKFNHHVVENITPSSYLVLERVVADAHQYQAVGMCSIGMLPSDPQYRTRLLSKCIDMGTSLHFVFEQIIVSETSDIAALNDLLSLTSVSQGGETQIRFLRDLIGPSEISDG